jgi:heme-degrading monooxygenase HmoA
MIVAVSRFNVAAADAVRLEARFQSRPCLVDAHDGLLGLEVLRTVGRTPTFMLVTRCADRAALKRYMRSPDFRAVHQGNEEDRADFAIYEVVTAT